MPKHHIPDLIRTSSTPEKSRTRPTPVRPISTKKTCTLIFIEIGFSRDLGFDKKHTEKTEKYSPLVAALMQYWGRVEFVAIPIGHAGTTLSRTLDHLTAAFSTARPRVDHTNANKGTSQPITDSNAKSHDYLLFKSLLDALIDLAQSRLLGIIRNRKRLVEALPGAIRRARAHSAATPTYTNATSQHGLATHTHRTRTTRVPEGPQSHKRAGRRIGAHLHPGPHYLRDPVP